MIHNIDIDSLNDKFQNWRIVFVKSKEQIIINGSQDANLDELFSLLKKISADCHFNVTIDLNNNSEISAAIACKKTKAKYNRMYTSGCFDIFHYGHLNILERSKELCDYLVVGVSTDELIEKEKGKRPIIPFEERVKIVKAIKFVDEVIPQIDKNKQRVVDEYHIDAISVGDDWRGRFPKTSCPVEYFSYTENVSSTILKDILKLKNS
ncbi:adenylyltransferase/cytidyltransferase family protein [Mariniflexile litorale]|uniref:Adenylyltransferase/cytidyltransferase family protein n=1 Tax=Mariniflexile litorale TaxID=3045158 RepID=A0AAU7EGJ4_9FLAO|nr:adenylyltransferase/cytidyltransferase family protein [Mariniflexile sp. KMM 9835]MDQ8210802.1 adenylyltransferase/cytidyltransferase family protein [Mariniflexile sp. KMM 9835]